MSDPLTATGTTALVSATIAAPAVGIDYGVIFGAFIGAMFYVTQAKDIPRIRQAFSFVVSFGTGVLGASVAGAKLSAWLNYNDTPLEPLGALIISAVAVKLLTFVSEKMEDPTSLFSRFREARMASNDISVMWLNLIHTVTTSDPLVVLNVLLCSAIVCRPACFRKTGYRHRAWIAAGMVGYLRLFMDPVSLHCSAVPETHWGVIAANLIICIALYRVKGTSRNCYTP